MVLGFCESFSVYFAWRLLCACAVSHPSFPIRGLCFVSVRYSMYPNSTPWCSFLFPGSA